MVYSNVFHKLTFNAKMSGAILLLAAVLLGCALVIISPFFINYPIALTTHPGVFVLALLSIATFTVLILFVNIHISRNTRLLRTVSQYKSIVNGSSDAIIGVSLSGGITVWNKASESLFDISTSDAMNTKFEDIIALSSIDIHAHIEAFTSEPRKTNTQCETSHKTEHTERIFELKISAITTQDEQVVGVWVVCKDITSHKNAQTLVTNINQSLEQKVKNRTRELTLAKNEAEHANVIKSAFISNISHEMRTPLNGILGTLELVANEPLSDTQKSYLKMTETSICSLNALINDILDLSKIEAGKMRLDNTAFDLLDEFERTMLPIAIKAYDKNLTFSFDMSGVTLRRLMGDKNRINQITNNILSNAVKFTHQGDVSVFLQSHQLEKDVVILCAVTDSGIGIEKHCYDNIFGTFNQEDSSISGTFGGTGLGLSICKQLSKLMHGDVTFTSKKGFGSTFYFSLLVTADDPQHDHSTLLKDTYISLACEHTKESYSIKSSLQSYGSVVFDVAHPHQFASTTNILLIDEHHPHKHILTERFINAGTPNAKIVEMLSPQAFSQAKTCTQHTQHFTLMKPFTPSSLLTLLQECEVNKVVAPRVAPDAPYYQGTQQSDHTTLLAKQVLIVDDNEINVEVIKGMISAHVGAVFCATNGKDAITMLKRSLQTKKRFDLVLLDCNMPIMDGFECVKGIRRGDAGIDYKNIVVIAVTADAMLGDQEKCLGAGMNDYLSKPIKSALLVETLAKWSPQHL